MENVEHVLYLCTVLLCMNGIAFSVGSEKTGVIAIARCRARCLTKFLGDSTSDDACRDSTHCESCWNVCEPIFSNYEKWEEVCRKKKVCGTGCRVACKFRKKPTRGPVADDLQFSEIPAVTIEAEKRVAYMAWAKPKNRGAIVTPRISLVYVLLSRDLAGRTRNSWQQTLQTADDTRILDLSELPHDPEFWLLAVGESGTVAGIRFNTTIPEQMIYTGHVDIPEKINFPSKHSPTIAFDNSPLKLYMNMTSSGGKLIYDLFWENPRNITSPGTRDYQIYIYRGECDCDAEPDYISTIQSFGSNIKVKPRYRLKDIYYNADYKVIITLTSDERWNGSVLFTTPECIEMPPLDYTICRHDTNTSPEVVRKTTTTTATLKGPIQKTHQVDSESVLFPSSENTFMPEWNITEVSKKYDKMSHHVFVTLKWTSAFNDSDMAIRWTNQYNGKSQDIDTESPTMIDKNTAMVELKLKPDTVYMVHVEETINSSSGDVIKYRSRISEINTNLTDMPRIAASRRTVLDKEKVIFNGIILGVTILSSVIIFGIIIVFIYKKRQSFRDIIITKTAVAKSNSYKSNVGCKVDYSNQMLITSDDWEVDCRQLKLSGHIGQGAFGKVVTGHYNDERVAVKLVRDSAPISYKEDLLAEIELMKRLGSHPNIVSMIGACTIMEPICLVMEYIPYGNLQNFLKIVVRGKGLTDVRKCRLEGELSVNTNHGQELNYSLMDERGGINEGIVTPADLLSFARQVAMAMVLCTKE